MKTLSFNEMEIVSAGSKYTRCIRRHQRIIRDGLAMDPRASDWAISAVIQDMRGCADGTNVF